MCHSFALCGEHRSAGLLYLAGWTDGAAVSLAWPSADSPASCPELWDHHTWLLGI